MAKVFELIKLLKLTWEIDTVNDGYGDVVYKGGHVVASVHLNIVSIDTSAPCEQSSGSEDNGELTTLCTGSSPAVGGGHNSGVWDQRGSAYWRAAIC